MKGFLLDTNIISELIRPRPDPAVVAWIAERVVSELFIASITIGELTRGAQKIGNTERGLKLQNWIAHEIMHQFNHRILAFDTKAARVWGSMMGDSDRRGATLPAADAQIAAIAHVNQLSIATRYTKDFERMLESVVNPFLSAHQ